MFNGVPDATKFSPPRQAAKHMTKFSEMSKDQLIAEVTKQQSIKKKFWNRIEKNQAFYEKLYKILSTPDTNPCTWQDRMFQLINSDENPFYAPGSVTDPNGDLPF